MKRWTWMLVVLASLGLGQLGCGDDEDSKCPVCPGRPGEPTLQNIWPNADSTAWTYFYLQTQWPDSSGPAVFPDSSAVPPVPTLDSLERSLWAGYPAGSAQADGIYRLQFQGQNTTESGAHGQLLRETGYSTSQENPPPPPQKIPAVFYEHLSKARPDLRAKLAARGLLRSTSETGPARQAFARTTGSDLEWSLFLLHGGTWTKTPLVIGGYGNADTLISWTYLEENLSPGHEFTQRLIPSLASGVYLHGLILPRRSVVTEAGTFANCVECAYLIDYGLSLAVTESGAPLGYFRSWEFGSVVYAPGIGPIAAEQRTPPLGPLEPTSAILPFSQDVRLNLLGTNALQRNP